MKKKQKKKHPKSELKQKRKTNASPDMSSKTKSWHAKLKKWNYILALGMQTVVGPYRWCGQCSYKMVIMYLFSMDSTMRSRVKTIVQSYYFFQRVILFSRCFCCCTYLSFVIRPWNRVRTDESAFESEKGNQIERSSGNHDGWMRLPFTVIMSSAHGLIRENMNWHGCCCHISNRQWQSYIESGRVIVGLG